MTAISVLKSPLHGRGKNSLLCILIGSLLGLASPTASSQVIRGGTLDETQPGSAAPTTGDSILFKRRFNLVDDRELRQRGAASATAEGGDHDNGSSDEPLYDGFTRYIRETSGKTVVDAMPIKRSMVQAPKLPDSYVVGHGDQIEIQVWGSLSTQYMLTVDDTGRIFVPDVGSVQIAGVKAGDLTSVLTTSFRRLYKGFELRALVGIARGVSISVAGQAASVGLKNISATHTLLSATLSVARPAPGGSRRFIEFRRNGQAPQRVDLYCFLRADCPPLPETLRDGDTISIPERGKLVAISGGVPRTGIYELAPGEKFDDLLRYSGGLSVIADPTRIYHYEFSPNGQRRRLFHTLTLEALCAKSAGLSGTCAEPTDGDYFDIQTRLPNVDGAITLAVQGLEPIKLEFKPGMRLLDVVRAPFDNLLPSKTARAINGGVYAALADLDEKIKQLDLESLTLYRLDKDKREYVPSSVSYKAAQAAADSDANVPLRDGDILVIEDLSDWKMRRDQMSIAVRVMGEVGKPGRYRFTGRKSLNEVLQLAGGLGPNAALWSAVVLRQGDGSNAVNREMLDRALAAIAEHQLRQEQANTDRQVSAIPIRADRSANGKLQTLNSRTQAEVAELLKGRDVVYLSGKDITQWGALLLAPNDVIIVPPRQDTFACQGAFFRQGEFLVGKEPIRMKDAAEHCGLISEMNPSVYQFVSRENRVCRPGWLRSCPAVQGGDMLVAVPEVVTRRGMAAVTDWLDATFKTLASLATIKVLTQ